MYPRNISYLLYQDTAISMIPVLLARLVSPPLLLTHPNFSLQHYKPAPFPRAFFSFPIRHTPAVPSNDSLFFHPGIFIDCHELDYSIYQIHSYFLTYPLEFIEISLLFHQCPVIPNAVGCTRLKSHEYPLLMTFIKPVCFPISIHEAFH